MVTKKGRSKNQYSWLPSLPVNLILQDRGTLETPSSKYSRLEGMKGKKCSCNKYFLVTLSCSGNGTIMLR